jgi:hypothetical protein
MNRPNGFFGDRTMEELLKLSRPPADSKGISEAEDREFLNEVSRFHHRVAMALHREAARLNFDWCELDSRYPGATMLIPDWVLCVDPERVDIATRPGETKHEKANRRRRLMPGYRKKTG